MATTVFDTCQVQMWDMVATVEMAEIADLNENYDPTGCTITLASSTGKLNFEKNCKKSPSMDDRFFTWQLSVKQEQAPVIVMCGSCRHS